MAEDNGEQESNEGVRARSWVGWALLIVLIGIALLLLILIVIFSGVFPDWFGLSEIRNDSGEIVRTQKTIWDFLELLIVPAVLAIGAALIAHSQQKRELEERKVDREIAKKARKVSQEIAEKATEADREIAIVMQKREQCH